MQCIKQRNTSTEKQTFFRTDNFLSSSKILVGYVTRLGHDILIIFSYTNLMYIL